MIIPLSASELIAASAQAWLPRSIKRTFSDGTFGVIGSLGVVGSLGVIGATGLVGVVSPPPPPVVEP